MSSKLPHVFMLVVKEQMLETYFTQIRCEIMYQICAVTRTMCTASHRELTPGLFNTLTPKKCLSASKHQSDDFYSMKLVVFSFSFLALASKKF